MFDNKPLTDEEWQIFKCSVQDSKNGPLLSYKVNDKCIANALCSVGSHRRQPDCGTYASNVRDTITRAMRHEFSEEELETIVHACMNDENNNDTIKSVLSDEIMEKLSSWVPVFISRRKKLKDLLDD